MLIRRKNIYKNYVVLGALSVCVPSFALAQNNDKDSVTELNPIVIKGKIIDASDSVTVLTNRVTAKDIDAKQVSDVNDISRIDPSVSYDPKKNSFVIRGVNADRVLTTIDGIVLPWFEDIVRGRGGNTTFDFNALSTLDIIQGSDSSLYGSGAIGGVVALHTLNPEDIIVEGKNWGGIVKGGYNSVDRSWRVDQAIAARSRQTFLLFQGSHTEGHERKNMGTIDGYVERTRKNPANFDQNNLLVKVHQYFDDNHRLGFTAERFGYSNVTHSLNASARYFPGSVYDQDNKHRERLSLSYDYNGDKDAVFDAFHGQVYWQKQSNNHIMSGYRVKAPEGEYLRDNLVRDVNYGLSANTLKSTNIGTVGHTFKFAANALLSKFHHYMFGKDNCHLKENARGCAFLPANRSESPDTDSYNFGLAFEDEMGFSDNRFRVTPGIRYDWYKHTPQKTASYDRALIGIEKYPSEKSGSHFSPKLRAELDIRDQVTLYAQWAQAFRAPRASELYLAYIKPGLYYVKGSPDLKPETSNGYDIGVQFGSPNFGGSVSSFINQYKDFIDTIDKGPSEEFAFSRRHYVNRTRVRIFGVETKAHLILNSGLRSNFSLSYSQGKDLDKDEHLSSIFPLKAVVGLGYAKSSWGTDIVLTLSAKRDKLAKGSEDQEVPGYKVVDVSGWLKPFGETGPIIKAGVYNLFNEKYWNVSDLPAGKSATPKDYYSQPGRNFKVSFVQKF
ncbi:TonB-dependent hemoglobin/transferrin/lactoferrin family receptor [Bartonella sp. CB178]|uniref:TonB-dependent hemoglobin/transferrin/lactoferrin family receptor n=1 Tax=Bartonella sp. CB178 TaxID=3112255 RepID=UPI00300DD22B